MKQIVSTVLIAVGLVVVVGSESSDLSTTEVLLQGVLGLAMMFIGLKLSNFME